MPERTLTVRIIGDDRSLQQAFSRSQKAGRQFEVGVAGIGAATARGLLPAAAAAVSVQKAFQFAGQSVNEASAINEEVAKSEQVFGDAAAEVVAWSETMARSFGVSKRAALEASGVFGNLFSVVGIGPKAAAELSRSLVELAADMASFNNASPEDVLLAIRSGLVGEAEPLRRYGVLLSEARVQQVALAESGKENAKQLTNQEKAYARYSILIEDTAKAQGDVARTSDSLANQQRFLRAQVRDLSAAFGSLLIPKMLETVGAVNDLIGAFGRLQDAAPGGTGGAAGGFFDELFKSLPAQGADMAERLQQMGEDIDFVLRHGPFRARGDDFEELGKAIADDIAAMNRALEGAVPITSSIAGHIQASVDRVVNAMDAARAKLLKAQARANRRESERAGKAWNEYLLGMDLKLKTADLTRSESDNLAALRELEASILRRIRAEGRTFQLASELTDVRLRIASVVASQADDAARATEDAWNSALDALDLDLDIARATRGFADDLSALRAIESQILKQIAAEGRTTDLLRRLFENRQAQADAIRDRRNAAAFEALGLTPEGERRVAGRRALLRRAQSLREQVKGTVLDTPKTRAELDRIVAVLKNKTLSSGREIRQAILDMLNDISSAFDEGADSGGPLTKFAKRGANKLIEGLGLTPEQVKEIRQRFSQFGRLDLERGERRPPGRTVVPSGPREGRPGSGIDRDVTVNVYIDGQKVEASVTRRQQKKRGRNAPQRRGVNPGARR